MPVSCRSMGVPISAAIRPWLGDSRGHYEGATLVVETTNFGEPDSRSGARTRTCGWSSVFRWIGPNTLVYKFTVDDATAFTKPWTVRLPMTRSRDRI